MKKLATGIIAGSVMLCTLAAFNSSNNESKTIQNNHEWDQLTEVVIGRWVPETYEVAEVDLSMKEHFPYIAEKAWDYFKIAEGKMLHEVYAEDDQRYYQEHCRYIHISVRHLIRFPGPS